MLIILWFRYHRVDGFEATNYIFRQDTIEICYILENAVSFPKDDLKQKLASHLKIKPETLKLTELRARPVFKETNIRPGESARIEEHFSMGAFVKLDGKVILSSIIIINFTLISLSIQGKEKLTIEGGSSLCSSDVVTGRMLKHLGRPLPNTHFRIF